MIVKVCGLKEMNNINQLNEIDIDIEQFTKILNLKYSSLGKTLLHKLVEVEILMTII